MEISKQTRDGTLVVTVVGRLDAYWADHLSKALDDAVRDGADRIELDMSGVDFMSSVGIRVLLRFYKQLQRLDGSFAVANPSLAVRSILELAGLGTLLVAAAAPAGAAPGAQPARHEMYGNASFDVFDLAPGSSLRCRLVGRPELLDGCRFTAADCRWLRFPDSTFGVGLGGFGRTFEECRGRFGEFLAAAGGVAYLPTDGTNVPDHLLAAGALVPEVAVLYSLVCDGAPAQLARFEATEAHATLTELAGACLEISAADCIGVVMVAESAGLRGAALRRSPVLASARAPFAHPEIREWLSFTSERAFARSLALVVGVAARQAPPALASVLRPLGSAPQHPSAHFHAAAFSYRPLQKGRIDLRTTVAALFAGETVEGVLHLLNDDREIVGGGDSEFVRGACWIGPLGDIRMEVP